MDLELQGRKALVSGGSAGIGLACARGLAREGCEVAIVARDQARLDAAAGTLRAAGARVHRLAVDLGSLDGVNHAIAAAVAALGRIDVLVNNAGAIRPGEFLEIPDAQWIEDWNLKLLGYVRMARAVLPLMQRNGGGVIVNVIGSAARQPDARSLVNGAANAALVNFTKGLADVGASHGVLVKAASPGPVETERWERRLRGEAEAEGKPLEAVRAQRLQAFPLGRITSAADVADLVCYLASPRSAMLNGVTITIDGGVSRGVYP